MEVSGSMDFNFSDGSKLHIQGSPNEDEKNNFKFSIADDRLLIEVFEEQGLAKTNNDEIISGSVLLQSELTANLISCLLNSQVPDLPTLKQSVLQHRPLLIELTKNFKKSNNGLALPIT